MSEPEGLFIIPSSSILHPAIVYCSIMFSSIPQPVMMMMMMMVVVVVVVLVLICQSGGDGD